VNGVVAERPMEILLVDDNPGDVRLTEEALRDGEVESRLHIARDGLEALDFLYREGEHACAPRPDLILLDLNMPRMSGRQVLAEIKEDPLLKHIPVVILTGSWDMEDVMRMYDLHANCYVTKPIDLDQYMMMVRSITDFWFTLVKLPEEEI